MKQIHSPTQLHDTLRHLKAQGKSIGFVPTMGALHAGHLSLVRKARQQNDVTVVSIFVNPTQFGPKEDFSKYPRPLNKDLDLLKKAKVDFVFTPSAEEMYPGIRDGSPQPLAPSKVAAEPSLKAMKAALPLTKNLCGKFRPGHFEGVMIVVDKLFRIVRPTRAYFGAKDYQQAAVIQKMNAGLRLGITVCVEPTIREKDGLAMSSRNQYLSVEERKRAVVIYKTLSVIKKALETTKRRNDEATKKSKTSFRPFVLSSLVKQAKTKLRQEVDKLQYLKIVDPKTLKPLKRIQRKMVVLTACYVGKTRLIDNVIITALKRRSSK